jgi:hypothetical protein
MSIWVIIVGIAGIMICASALFFGAFRLFYIQRKKYLQRHKKAPNQKKLKTQYLEYFDLIEANFNDRKINENDVFFEVSRGLRSYASDKENANFHNFTLMEFGDVEGLSVLHETINLLYQTQYFDRALDPDPASAQEAIEWGRSLVRRW